MDDRLCTVDYSRDPSGFTPHTHSTYEILYLVHGEAEVCFGGAAVTAKAPAAVLVNCLEEHATHILSGNMSGTPSSSRAAGSTSFWRIRSFPGYSAATSRARTSTR